MCQYILFVCYHYYQVCFYSTTFTQIELEMQCFLMQGGHKQEKWLKQTEYIVQNQNQNQNWLDWPST